jgi:formylglycine-generating enzyme required for sulfatase activity
MAMSWLAGMAMSWLAGMAMSWLAGITRPALRLADTAHDCYRPAVALKWSWLMVVAALVPACAARGVVLDITPVDAWPVAVDVMKRRGELLLRRDDQYRLQIEHSRHYPDDLLIADRVTPRTAESFGRTRELVEVELGSTPAGVTVEVSAWREYRAFARTFERERAYDRQREVLEHLLADLAHQRDRRAIEATLAAQRASRQAEQPEGMLWIPAGPFTLGDEVHLDEQPPRTIELAGYWIDRHEVTVGAYRRFLAQGGYGERRWWCEAGWRWKVTTGVVAPKTWRDDLRDTLPVFGVSWYEASAYARWQGKSLPTEAQWEKAAEYGQPSRYPWGNTWIEGVNCLTAAHYGPLPVGSHPSGVAASGCHDMAGNVAEWCRDGYASDSIATAALRDPTGPVHGRFRVLRGGSFFSSPDAVRTGYRDRAEPGEQAVAYGFRCVIEVGTTREGAAR